MNFERRIKGHITESLVQTLLEHAGYRVVPLGIEHIIREVKDQNNSSFHLHKGPLWDLIPSRSLQWEKDSPIIDRDWQQLASILAIPTRDQHLHKLFLGQLKHED